jgi:adenylate cyclase
MEIERKFLIKEMPDLSGYISIKYERYYLRVEPDLEERIQRVGDIYERETKARKSELERTSDKIQITEEEFNRLKPQAQSAIVRDSYLVSDNPEITIKIYHGQHEGLVRAETEFNTLEEARAFIPLDWMGGEITNSPLGRDSQLLGLSKEEFKQLLGEAS